MAEVIGTVNLVLNYAGGGSINLNQAVDTGTCFIETKDMDLDREDLTKFLQKVYAKIKNLEDSTSIKIIVKYRDDENSPLISRSAIAFSGNPVVPMRPPGAKFYRIRIEDLAISVRWKLYELELFGAIGGTRFG